MASFKAFLSTGGVFHVHAAGCRDLSKLVKSQHAEPFDVQAEAREAIAAELHADFIDEGSMTPDEALDYVDFLPCTGLR